MTAFLTGISTLYYFELKQEQAILEAKAESGSGSGSGSDTLSGLGTAVLGSVSAWSSTVDLDLSDWVIIHNPPY